jgi:hypothetical protein
MTAEVTTTTSESVIFLKQNWSWILFFIGIFIILLKAPWDKIWDKALSGRKGSNIPQPSNNPPITPPIAPTPVTPTRVVVTPQGLQWFEKDPFKGLIKNFGSLLMVPAIILLIFFIRWAGGIVPLTKSAFNGKDTAVIEAERIANEKSQDSARAAEKDLKLKLAQEREETARARTTEREETKRLDKQLQHERELKRLENGRQSSQRSTGSDGGSIIGNPRSGQNFNQPKDNWFPDDLPPQGPLH